jgi:ubiquitin-protein ligase E3 A
MFGQFCHAFGWWGRVNAVQVSHEVDFEVAHHDLIPDGGSIPVTATNRDEFVQVYIEFLLNQRIAPQFEAFERGFYRVCDRSMMTMFESCPSELEEVVCGTQTRDFEELRRSTVYEGNAVSGESEFIKWFWEVVMSFGEKKQRQLLQFVTGNDRAPVGGLGSLVPQFKIVKNGEHSNRLPTAHVCFNVLLLPQYASKEILADRLAKAIENDQGFGLA